MIENNSPQIVPALMRPRRGRRLWPWILLAVVGLLLVTAFTMPYWLSPILHREVVSFLERKYRSDVGIDRFSVSFLPKPHVTIEGLRLQQRDREGVPPLIAIRRVVADAGWMGLLSKPRHASRVHLDGLVITIARGRGHGDKKEPAQDRGFRTSTPIVIDQILADGTLLRIIPADPEKDPMDYDLFHLRLQRAGADRPMDFQADLRIPTPPGLIHTRGKFGPWYSGDPGKSPVGGNYEFRNADLGSFKGLGGILSSDGTYDGVLERLEVKGWTDMPDFEVDAAGNKMHLRTNFEATVDGTSGDTALHPVIAKWGTSTLVANGSVHGTPGRKGKTVSLQAVMSGGQVQDVLLMGVKCAPPPLTGRIQFRADLEIPPGKVDVMKKLRMKGNFRIDDARFASSAIQDKLDNFSQRALGDPKNTAESPVRPGFEGQFRSADGPIQLKDLRFHPGRQLRAGQSATRFHRPREDEGENLADHHRLQIPVVESSGSIFCEKRRRRGDSPAHLRRQRAPEGGPEAPLAVVS
ncbi:MAG: hypothetical protein NTY38_04110 [Acidobacteria bacterium]|nr:hypothetical protein [Acidobacteriota bacterium]